MCVCLLFDFVVWIGGYIVVIDVFRIMVLFSFMFDVCNGGLIVIV